MRVFVSARITPAWIDRLSQRCQVDHYDWAAAGRMLTADEITARLSGCAVLITESDDIPAAVIEASPELAAIIDCRGTPVNIDLTAADRRGIVVVNTPGRNADAVAELTVALMIMVARNLLQGAEAMKDGRWVIGGKRWAYTTFQGDEVGGSTVGLIGLGAIGRRVAQRLACFGVRLLAHDPFVPAEQAEAMGVELVLLDGLLRQSDFVSLHLPDNDATKGMLGRRELGLMRPTAYLINTARAAVVDETALIDALSEKRIAGAALDVFHREPLEAESPLLRLPNVVCIPHLGGASKHVTTHQSRMAVEGLFGLLDGEPINVVNPEQLDRALARLRG